MPEDSKYIFIDWGGKLGLNAKYGVENLTTPELFLNRDASARHELELDGHLVGFTNDSSRIVTHDQTGLVLWSFPGLERLKSWDFPGLDVRTYEEVRDRMLLTVEHDPSTPQQLVGRVRPIEGDSVRTFGRWPEGPDSWQMGRIDSQLEWRASVEAGRARSCLSPMSLVPVRWPDTS